MAGNVNDRFKQVATTSMLSSSSIQQNLTTSGTSMNQAYLNALSDVESTSDEVDRTSDSSDTEMSSAEKTQMWIGLGTAILSAAPAIMGAISAFTNKGGGQGGGAAAGDAAGGGDPIAAIDSAIDAYKSNPTKETRNALTTSIATATSTRDNIQSQIGGQLEKINSYNEILADGNVAFTECQDTINDLSKAITGNQKIIDDSDAIIARYDENIKNLQASDRDNSAAITQVDAKTEQGQQAINEAEVGIDEKGNIVKITKDNKDQIQSIVNDDEAIYNMAYNAHSGLKSAFDNAQDKYEIADSEVAGAERLLENAKSMKKSNKKAGNSVATDESAITQAKKDLKAKEDARDIAKELRDKAKKELEDNEKLQEEYAKKIKIDGTKLNEAIEANDLAISNKATAVKLRDDACETLKGFINEKDLLSAARNQIKDDAISAEFAKADQNEQLAISLSNDAQLVQQHFDVTETKDTLQKELDTLKKEIGYVEKDGKVTDEIAAGSPLDQIAQLDAAIQRGRNALGLKTNNSNNSEVDSNSSTKPKNNGEVDPQEDPNDISAAGLEFNEFNYQEYMAKQSFEDYHPGYTNLHKTGDGTWECKKDGKTYTVSYENGRFGFPIPKFEMDLDLPPELRSQNLKLDI